MSQDDISKSLPTIIGTCGTTRWEITGDGCLVVTGGMLSNGDGTGECWPWHAYADSILFASFKDVTAGDSVACLLADCKNLMDVDLYGLDTSQVTDMSCMFDECHSLASVDLTRLDTHSVTSMALMFADCHALSSVTLRLDDQQRMRRMFDDLLRRDSLEGFDPVGTFTSTPFDTGSVTDMQYMFFGCRALSAIDVAAFDTHNVMNMERMFDGCSSLKSLDLSTWDTKRVSNMSHMLDGTVHLCHLDLTGIDMRAVEWADGMFANMPSLDEIVLGGEAPTDRIFGAFAEEETRWRTAGGSVAMGADVLAKIPRAYGIYHRVRHS